MKKFLLIAIGVLTSATLLILATLFALPQKGVPQYSGKADLVDLKAPVKVSYDKVGIPHIKAESEQDAYRALGYVMAQDRLLQMDLIRRVATGRLAELVGEKALKSDKLFRTLALTRNYQLQKEQGLLDPAIESSLLAFIGGVNDFIKRGQFPFEYLLLGSDPAPFTVEDSYSILGYMAYSFAMGLKADLFYESLEQGEDLKAYPAKKRMSFEETLFFKGHQFAQDSIGLFTGSNAWVLSKERTKKGEAPLLASDPHVRFSSPGLWYEAHVKWPHGEFYGHFVPLLPFAAMVHNKTHGWGVTISYIDDMDFSYERLQEGKVISLDGKSPLETLESEIKIKGEEPLKWQVQFGPRGPLIDHVLTNALKKESFLNFKEGERLSMKWGHYNPQNSGMKTLYYAQRAKSVKEFEKAMTYAGSPGLNIIYAHKEANHIARYIVGTQYERVGVRSREVNKGWLLSKDSSKHWRDVPFEQRPHLRNPAKGVIVSANQKPEDTADQFAGYFHPMDRYHTIHHLLEGQEKWDSEEMKVVQTANTNVFFFSHRDRIGEVILKEELSEYEREVALWFMKWNGLSEAQSGEALLYYKFIEFFRRAAFAELSESQFQHYCGLNDFSFAVFRRLYEERYREFISLSFKKAVAQLRKSYGEGFKGWQLGREHTLTFPHPLGKASALLAKILDHGPYPIDGGFHQINHMREVGCKSGLKVEAGPSTRRIVDFENPRESLGILPMGNSGHRGSPFLFNQWPLFKEGKYRAQLMRELKESELHSELVIHPKK